MKKNRKTDAKNELRKASSIINSKNTPTDGYTYLDNLFVPVPEQVKNIIVTHTNKHCFV